MTRIKGFTLIESLIVLAITALLCMFGLPALTNMIKREHVRSTSNMLIRSLQIARSAAVLRREAVCVANKNSSWNEGWVVFVDDNRNCVLDDNDEKLFVQNALPNDITTVSTLHAKDHFLFVDSGKSEQLNGGFQADSVYFCSGNSWITNVRVVVWRTGRVRSEEVPLDSPKCQSNS